MLRALHASLLSSAVLAALPASAVEPEKAAAALGLLRQIDEGFVQVFEKVAPSVVVINAAKKQASEDEDRDEMKGFDFFFKEGEPRKEGEKERQRTWPLPQSMLRSEGSGFLLRSDGYILTNHHVVSDSEKLEVRLRDGRIFPAKLIAADDKTDIAVVKIEARDLPAVELGDSDALRVGQLVCAIGAPFSQDYSFTCGWVSGKGRNNLLSPNSPTILYEDYIQTDAFINPGNSGGPLFDVEGRVIGMNTLINGIGRGLAFAIPSNMLVEISEQLITRGKVQRPWLGIRIETLSANAALRERIGAIEKGVIVETIEANAPAYKSDLRAADLITEVDGVKLASARDLQKEILRKKVGQIVQLTVWRNGATLKVPVTTGELPAELTRVSNPAVPEKAALPKAESFGLKLKDAKPSGAVVTEVAADSPAAKADVQPNDVITQVENEPVSDAAACLAAIGKPGAGKKKSVLLNLERKGKRTYAVLAE